MKEIALVGEVKKYRPGRDARVRRDGAHVRAVESVALEVGPRHLEDPHARLLLLRIALPAARVERWFRRTRSLNMFISMLTDLGRANFPGRGRSRSGTELTPRSADARTSHERRGRKQTDGEPVRPCVRARGGSDRHDRDSRGAANDPSSAVRIGTQGLRDRSAPPCLAHRRAPRRFRSLWMGHGPSARDEDLGPARTTDPCRGPCSRRARSDVREALLEHRLGLLPRLRRLGRAWPQPPRRGPVRGRELSRRA